MKRVAIIAAGVLAFATLLFAQGVPGSGLFYEGGGDPWWRPLNPQGQSYGVTVGTARPSPPMNGEMFLDMNGAADSGPLLEVYDGVNDEWDGVGASGVVGALTDNTIPVYDSSTVALEDSNLTDDGTDISLTIGAEFRLDDGSTADDAIVFGNTQDYAIYWDNSLSDLIIDAIATSGNVRIVGNSSTAGAAILTLHGQGDPTTFIHTFRDLQLAGVGGTLVDFGAGGTVGIMAGSNTTRGLLFNLVNANHTGTGNTMTFLEIPAVTGDANSNLNGILIGALTGTAGAASEVEIAINIGAGWDYGLSILADGSATDDNITLGASQTADAQIYWTGAGLQFDVDGTAGNDIGFVMGVGPSALFTYGAEAALSNYHQMITQNTADTGVTVFNYVVTAVNATNGSDIINVMQIDWNETDWATVTETLNGLNIDAITQDAQGSYNAIQVETGWDLAFESVMVDVRATLPISNATSSQVLISGTLVNSSSGVIDFISIAPTLTAVDGGTLNFIDMDINAGTANDGENINYINITHGSAAGGTVINWDDNSTGRDVIMRSLTGYLLRADAANSVDAYDFSMTTPVANTSFNYFDLDGMGVPAINGSETINALEVSMVIAGAVTGTGNTINLLDFDPITGDAETNMNAILIGALTGTTGSAGELETAINIGAGWDVGIQNASRYADTVQAVTGTDGGGRVTVTVTPTTGYVELDCQDVDTGCLLAFSEAGAIEGQKLTVVLVGLTAGDVTIPDEAGVLNGTATTWTGVDDTLSLVYTGALWVETGVSVN